MRQPPGKVRDAIVAALKRQDGEMSLKAIHSAVTQAIGHVSASSIRSHLGLNTPSTYVRTRKGHYMLAAHDEALDIRGGGLRETPSLPSRGIDDSPISVPAFSYRGADLYRCDCFDWLANREANSIHGVVTDPPYGLVEYSSKEKEKLRNGRGGVWRLPPSFDGHTRSPLPRFTTLTPTDLKRLCRFFERLGQHLIGVLVPGAHVVVASNPLVCHMVTTALASSGFEPRGDIVRLVMTMRGGDRPKNAHEKYKDVSVMARSMWEPWIIMRKPIEGRVQDNLGKWQTGGLRRLSDERPFGDVIESHPTRPKERSLAPHPSLKPQSFLRQIVRAILPLSEGIILDPFAGSGSTLAAACAVGYRSVGIENDKEYVRVAVKAIPQLANFDPNPCRPRRS